MKMRFVPNDSRLLQLYDKHARTLLRSQTTTENYCTRVRRILLEQMREEAPGIEQVAERLHLSVRSLQMRLKEEGTTYQQILNSVRKQMAMACLREPRVRKGEIAQLLGFSEISVFSRTFKKWTGQSPSEYQASMTQLV
ncbi:MAG: AraC family transcriptional regulator [Bacteroidetes bacterium]|jgi:AraC-like DNA-binding protein|nr:MAG: AraC family transcriptional regulator [Bacteroidota bacterium]